MRMLPPWFARGRHLALLVVAVAAVWVVTSVPTPALAAGADEDRDGPLPRLEQIGPTSPAPEPGTLEISPAVVEVAAPVDRRVEVRHVIANGLDAPLEIDVEVLPAEVTRDGPRVLDRPGTQDEDVTRLDLPLERLRLRSGDGAALISTAQADPGRARLLALRATAPDGARAQAFVVVTAEDVAADVDLELALAADGRAEVTARAARPAVVDVWLRARSWVGASSASTAADLLVGPEPRELPVAAPAARLPGPVAATAGARDDDQTWSVSAERIVLPGLPWVAGLVLLLVVLVVGMRRRRLRLSRGDGAS